MFGEVYDGNPAVMSRYTTTGKLPATLDFGFQGSALGFAQGKATTNLRDFYAGDDYYTDTDSNAYELPTFLGNHDMGRVGMMLKDGGATGQRPARPGRAGQLADVPDPRPAGGLLRRRAGLHRRRWRQGRPPGHVRDQGRAVRRRAGHRPAPRAARTATTRSRRCTSRSRGCRRCARPTRRSPTVRRSTATPPTARASSPSAGSTRRTGTEYLVVANNATTAKTASFATYSPRMGFSPLYGSDTTAALRPGRPRRRHRGAAVGLGVEGPLRHGEAEGRPGGPPHLAAGRWRRRWARRDRRRDPRQRLRAGHLRLPAGGDAGLDDRSAPTTTRRTGSSRTSPRVAKGTLLEYRAVAKDGSGNVSAASSYGIVGDPAPGGGGGPGPVGPVTQPDNVSVPGTHNSEMGCPGDWQPDCAQAQLTLDAQGPDLEGHLHHHPGRVDTTTRRRSTRAGTRTTAPGERRVAATSPTPRPVAT